MNHATHQKSSIRRFTCCLPPLAGCLLFATGCQTVPLTGRSQLMLSSESSEIALGAQAYDEYKAQYPVSKNAAQNAALARVGQAIKAAAQKDDYQWAFTVLESPDANAFCLPGGKVAVYSGLFAYTANDAELACVVGHEVGHALARHGGERSSWGTLQSLGLAGLKTQTESEALAEAYGLATNVGVLLPFSRKQESEADRMGLMLMARAGYDPAAALSFWQKFGATPSGTLEKWLSTHPGGDVRIAEIKANLPAAQAEYQKAATKRGLGSALK
jgi:predicted Zn-dependent protease